MKKLLVVLISVFVCFLGVIPVLSENKPSFRTEDYVYATLQQYQELTGEKIVKFHEAPMLKVRVAAGELPPVKERISEEPLVIKPVEKVGQYGGTLRVGSVGIAGWTDFTDARWAGMLRVNQNSTRELPYIAKGYKFTDNNKTLTLYLRKGMRWSDGSPFTADDILFWWNDVILNDELTPAKPQQWIIGGKLATFERINDYALRIHFAQPYPSAAYLLAFWPGRQHSFFEPKHYLKKWHIKYNPEANELAKKEGYDHWWEAFRFHSEYGPRQSDPDLPVVGAWKLEKLTPAQRLFVRNPYYPVIDTAGNQLPYIDSYIRSMVGDPETLKMKVVAGEFDVNWREITGEDYPVLKENQEKGGYRIIVVEYPGQLVHLGFNVNHKDPVKRKIFQDVRFRRAMSLAINREEINDIVFAGMGIPSADTPHSSCSFYKKEWRKAWAQYDPDRANKLLDEMGLGKRDEEGYRLRPDGKRLIIIIEYQERGPRTPVLELVKEYWEAVGIRTELKPEERSYYYTRVQAAEHDVGVWHADNMLEGALLASKSNQLNFDAEISVGRKWYQWWTTNGEAGEEPPEDVKQWFSGLDKLFTLAPGTSEYIKLAQKLYSWYIDQVYQIGTVAGIKQPMIINNKLQNVAMDGGIYTWDTLYEYPYLPEQWFFEK